MTNSVIRRLQKATILRVINMEPAFAEMFIVQLLGRTIRVEADLVDQLFNSSEIMLARLLLLLANFGEEVKPEPIIAKISQETLAEFYKKKKKKNLFFISNFGKMVVVATMPPSSLATVGADCTRTTREPSLQSVRG